MAIFTMSLIYFLFPHIYDSGNANCRLNWYNVHQESERNMDFLYDIFDNTRHLTNTRSCNITVIQTNKADLDRLHCNVHARAMSSISHNGGSLLLPGGF